MKIKFKSLRNWFSTRVPSRYSYNLIKETVVFALKQDVANMYYVMPQKQNYNSIKIKYVNVHILIFTSDMMSLMLHLYMMVMASITAQVMMLRTAIPMVLQTWFMQIVHILIIFYIHSLFTVSQYFMFTSQILEIILTSVITYAIHSMLN